MSKKQYFVLFKSDREEDKGLDVIMVFDSERRRKMFLQTNQGSAHAIDLRTLPPQRAIFNLSTIGGNKRLLSNREVKELDAKNNVWFWVP